MTKSMMGSKSKIRIGSKIPDIKKTIFQTAETNDRSISFRKLTTDCNESIYLNAIKKPCNLLNNLPVIHITQKNPTSIKMVFELIASDLILLLEDPLLFEKENKFKKLKKFKNFKTIIFQPRWYNYYPDD